MADRPTRADFDLLRRCCRYASPEVLAGIEAAEREAGVERPGPRQNPSPATEPVEGPRISRRRLLGALAVGGTLTATGLWWPGQRTISLPNAGLKLVDEFQLFETTMVISGVYGAGPIKTRKEWRLLVDRPYRAGDVVRLKELRDRHGVTSDEDPVVGIALADSIPVPR